MRPPQVEDDLDVLARRVEDLGHLLVAHQREERREVDVGRQRIDQRGDAGRRHLDQADLRPIGGLADELGVDGDEFALLESGDDRLKFVLGSDDVHEISLSVRAV